MLSIVGLVVVIICVLTGYTLEHGKMGALMEPIPIELLIILGSGVGSVLVSAPMPIIKEMMGQLGGVFKSHDPKKEEYVELLLCLYELCKLAKSNPLALEPHVEAPENSDIFKRYPGVLNNHHAVAFMTDTFKVQISSPMNPYDLEALMDQDIKAAHDAEHAAPAQMTKLGDAMPGLGIVAAVMGVVITMGRLTEGKEVIGHSVASALVGTFLGVLLSYGIIGPIAGKMENLIAQHGKYTEVIKVAVLAFAKDCGPKVCVEFARRTIPPSVRPSFQEIDASTSSAGKAAA